MLKLAEATLQSVLILFCGVSLLTNLLAFATSIIILSLVTIQVLSSVICRLKGGKSAMRTAYGLMVVLFLVSLFLSMFMYFFVLAGLSMMLMAVSVIYYNSICWIEIAEDKNEAF